MTPSYILILGRTPLLSMAELRGYAAARRAHLDAERLIGAVAVVKGAWPSPGVLVQDIAGIVKVVTPLACYPSVLRRREEWVACLKPHLLRQSAADASLTFGLSFYGERGQRLEAREQERLGLDLKRSLAASRHVRWVRCRGQALSSVQVLKNHLVDPGGVELIMVSTASEMLVGRTLAVQTFEDWSERDYGRPRRNARQGMLPPKLARMMVNMIGLSPRGVLLDPFCGSGTVLAEAVLAGWEQCLGADRDARAVAATSINLKWLAERKALRFRANVWPCPIERLLQKVAPSSIAAIVTEPFLGPPLRRPPGDREIAAIRRELEPLYRTMLQAFAHLLIPGGRAVFIVPHWRTASQSISLIPSLERVLPGRLRCRSLLPGRAATEPLLYHRPEQYVEREIVAVEKVA